MGLTQIYQNDQQASRIVVLYSLPFPFPPFLLDHSFIRQSRYAHATPRIGSMKNAALACWTIS